MDKEKFEKILLEQKRKNKSKSGQRPEQYKCKCGYYTGRKQNYIRHQAKCLLIESST